MEAQKIIEIIKEKELERWNMYVAAVVLQRNKIDVDFEFIEHQKAAWATADKILLDIGETPIYGERRFKLPEWFQR